MIRWIATKHNVWTFHANLTQDAGTWARLPLLNPLDLVQAVIFALAAFWLVRIHRLGVPIVEYRVPLQVVAGATGFIWLNAMLLRMLHHWTGVPYQFESMSYSVLVQASVSVFWTVCALAMMMWAPREPDVLVHRRRAAGGDRRQAFPVRSVACDGDRADRLVYRCRSDVAADRLLLAFATQGCSPGN